jgi:biotin synthase
MFDWMLQLVNRIKDGKLCERDEAEKIISLEKDYFHLLLFAATEVRNHFKKNTVKTCSIVNAKSGRCGEDCSFCAQSAHYTTDLPTYPLMSPDEILLCAKKEEKHSKRFGIVTAGKGLEKDEVGSVQKTISGFEDENLKQIPCASLGILTEEDFSALKEKGLVRYHHNLETSKNYYSKICTTHSYDDRVKTINAAKNAGLEICVGGILGLGESLSDRIDLLYEIKEFDPDSVPLNFLVPIKGTPLENNQQISMWEAVKVIALARFIMPDKDIKLGAGRLEVFKDAQHIVFLAGANGMIVGDLLTIKGRTPEDDLAVIDDLGLIIAE